MGRNLVYMPSSDALRPAKEHGARALSASRVCLWAILHGLDAGDWAGTTKVGVAVGAAGATRVSMEGRQH